MRSREGYFGVYFTSCEATSEINTKITLEWVHKPFATTEHTLFYFLHAIKTPTDKKNMTVATQIVNEIYILSPDAPHVLFSWTDINAPFMITAIDTFDHHASQ